MPHKPTYEERMSFFGIRCFALNVIRFSSHALACLIGQRMRNGCHFLASIDQSPSRRSAFHARLILWLDVHHQVICVVCVRYFSPLSTSFFCFSCVKRHSFLMRWTMRRSCDRAFQGDPLNGRLSLGNVHVSFSFVNAIRFSCVKCNSLSCVGLCGWQGLKGPVTRVPHRPTHEKWMPFLASVDIHFMPVWSFEWTLIIR